MRLSVYCLIGLLLVALSSLAHAELPAPVLRALQAEGLGADALSVYVQRVDQPAPLLAHQADIALNPASTMKLVTTYAGLELLGPAYRWRTEIYHDGVLKQGVLTGNLILKGYGDPSMRVEDLWRMLSRLRQQGVQRIDGDLLLDSSYFASTNAGPAAFDGEPYRAYNATPAALVMDLKATGIQLQADAVTQQVLLRAEPDPNSPGVTALTLTSQLKLVRSACGDWKTRLAYDVNVRSDASNARAVELVLRGDYALDCGEKWLDLSFFDEASHSYFLFRQLWQQLGGSFGGKLRVGLMPERAVKLLSNESVTLAEVVRDINKFSNNLMARQLLLTLAAEQIATPGTEANGARAVQLWLRSKGLEFPELVIENGAGLSRVERISSKHLADLLLTAYASPVMPELMSSLPILAVDGTLRKRQKDSAAYGRAHLKTGSLSNVRSIAGYVLDAKGRRWVVVCISNHAKAQQTRGAQDVLIDWLYSQP